MYFYFVQIIRLPCCLATCCWDCAQVFFAVQVRKDNIQDSFCPLCDTFHLTHYNGKIVDYLFKMMAILQDILDMQSYELFYKKYQALNLICSKYCGQVCVVNILLTNHTSLIENNI